MASGIVLTPREPADGPVSPAPSQALAGLAPRRALFCWDFEGVPVARAGVQIEADCLLESWAAHGTMAHA